MDPPPGLIVVPLAKGCLLPLTEREFVNGVHRGKWWWRRREGAAGGAGGEWTESSRRRWSGPRCGACSATGTA
jgi:hypothetical protein